VAEGYSYDTVGNRLTSARPTSYNYNSSNELTSTTAATYTYDNNGNTTSKTDSSGTTNYAWDFENRLASVTLPGTGGTVNFRYDPFGRRIEKASSAGTTIYAYDGDNVIQELNGAGSLVAEFTQGAGIDEPLALFSGATTSYFHADGLGSITSLTDGSGQLAASYVYDSFGNLAASTGTITNPFQYTARQFDTETGLYYYRARYYDPVSGRFLSQDPAGFASGTNFYPYVSNDPLNSTDPLGLCKLTPRMGECMELLLGPDVWSVQLKEGSLSKTWDATTRKNLIILRDPCDQFLSDLNTVLEEYYHVIKQWNAGRVSRLKYVVEYARHGYDKNKYEVEAKKFAGDNIGFFEGCVKCQD
jgi:RHS repeat-associated protein